MKRFHVHLTVKNIDESVRFYSTLFGTEPTVRKRDYARWMLDDPKLNLAISQHEGMQVGVDHLGIQADSDGELRTIAHRLRTAAETTRDQEATACCYALSNKAWINDPTGIRWETFFTFGEATAYGEDEDSSQRIQPQSACGAKAGCC